MRDIKALEAELRAGLEGVTPGPWRNMPKSDLELCKKDYAPGEHPRSPNIIAESVVSVDLVDGEPVLCVSEPTRAHIARCSPENIAALLDTIEQQRAAISSYEAARETGWRAVWVQNLISHIEGRVTFGDEWKAIFIEQLRALPAAPLPEQEPRPELNKEDR